MTSLIFIFKSRPVQDEVYPYGLSTLHMWIRCMEYILYIQLDIVKQGFGTTNDGNTARKIIREYKKSAHITKVDENLNKRFAVTWQVTSSGEAKFLRDYYCWVTAEVFVHQYPWYKMPAST
jgi:hypothetical protein